MGSGKTKAEKQYFGTDGIRGRLANTQSRQISCSSWVGLLVRVFAKSGASAAKF
jgi:phosphomannomutase